MKKVVLTFSFLALAMTSVFAQDPEKTLKDANAATNKAVDAAFAKAVPSDTLLGWKRSTQFGINASEATFSNWAAGGVNSSSLGLFFNHTANLYQKDWAWTNNIETQYGFLNTNRATRKSVDRIFLDSKYAHKLSQHWNLYAEATFLSQFAKGYHYDDNGVLDGGGGIASTFFAPAYLTEGIGLEYKPTSWFVLQLSPATLRQTIVGTKTVFNNTAIRTTGDDGKIYAYGVKQGSTIYNQIGSQLVAALNKDIAKNVNLRARYAAFFGYKSLNDKSPISHRLDLMATAKINKYLNVNFTLIGIYDEQAISRLQLNQGLAVGFAVAL